MEQRAYSCCLNNTFKCYYTEKAAIVQELIVVKARFTLSDIKSSSSNVQQSFTRLF